MKDENGKMQIAKLGEGKGEFEMQNANSKMQMAK